VYKKEYVGWKYRQALMRQDDLSTAARYVAFEGARTAEENLKKYARAIFHYNGTIEPGEREPASASVARTESPDNTMAAAATITTALTKTAHFLPIPANEDRGDWSHDSLTPEMQAECLRHKAYREQWVDLNNRQSLVWNGELAPHA
jgi:hypothetical protein